MKKLTFLILVMASVSAHAVEEKNKVIHSVYCNAYNDCYITFKDALSSAHPSCFMGLVKFGNTATTDKTLFQTRFSALMAAKSVGDKVSVNFNAVTGTSMNECTMTTFMVGEALL